MDEQRLQAYQQLIQQLLSCTNGEEPTILQANSELLDADFLQVVVGLAGMFSQEGEENTANWLLGLAFQLSQALNIPLEENTPETETPLNEADRETYLHFLLQVLQTTAESEGNPQEVYPLLAANTDKLNLTFAKVLRDWATTTIAEHIAIYIFNFSNLIQQFPLGNKANNMEIAITGYEIVSTVSTRQTSPENWAAVKNNLGEAYRNRIRGDKADNLEYAIKAYTAALEVYTRTDFPQYWADTQNNLGNTYSNRIRGDKAENLEYAIKAYTAALEVRTRTNFPQYWAMKQNNLGNAYRNRIRGDKAENLEYAIKAYTAALEVRTRTDFPQYWADTQNNLGNAYSDRIRGDKAENLEYAIAAFTAALEVYTRRDFPQNWADTQNNLGNAYSDRIRGDKAENLEYAIAAFTAALEMRTRYDFPVDWAGTQNNLGNAYSDRIRGDKAENLEYAIAAYTTALEVYTRNDFPVQWATTQNNLGNAYSNRIREDKAENLEYAIAAYTTALEVYTRNDFPEYYAKLSTNLGIAYQDSQQLDLAYDTFNQAIVTVESLRGEIISGEESKRKQAEEWNKLYRMMVEICLGLGRETEAISYIERSKTRNLVEQILSRDLENIFPSRVVTQLKELENEIANGQNLIQTGKAENYQNLAQNLQALRQQRQQLQDQYLPIGASFEFTSLNNIVDQQTAIIEWYIATNKLLAFVIQPGGKEIKIVESSTEDLDKLFDFANNYLDKYRECKEKYEKYQDKYNNSNKTPEDIKHLNNSLNELIDEYSHHLTINLDDLAQILQLEEILELVPSQGQKLILIPHRFLHLLPLHALPVKNSCLMDSFPQGVGYVPSLQILQQIQQRQRDNFQSFFAIQTPTKDLYEKDLGAVAAIKKQFAKSHILKQDKARESEITQNPENLKTAHNLFLFCHGSFNSTSPLDSGLQLADEVFTLADIITHLKLEQCRLVTLAACESGMIDGYNISDEYIGLPSGFLLAGSTNVVGSLWTVSAIATALLMVRFYEELKQQNNIILALQTAQRWLRDTKIQDFRTWLAKSLLSSAWQSEINKYFDILEQEKGVNNPPFELPVYWSAFCCIGKGV